MFCFTASVRPTLRFFPLSKRSLVPNLSKSERRTGNKGNANTMPFFAVRIGKNPGIYSCWEDCNNQVKGVSNARFKKFQSRQEAEAFLSQKSCEGSPTSISPPSSPSARNLSPHPHLITKNSISSVDQQRSPTTKRQKKNIHEDPSCSQTSFLSAENPRKSNLKIVQAVSAQLQEQDQIEKQSSHPVEIYVDGCSLNNQASEKSLVFAGVGIYFPSHSEL